MVLEAILDVAAMIKIPCWELTLVIQPAKINFNNSNNILAKLYCTLKMERLENNLLFYHVQRFS